MTGKTFILVHGGGHGGWAFAKVSPHLVQEGHAVLAPDLPGHGLNAQLPLSWRTRAQEPGKIATEPSQVAGLTLTDLASDLIGVVRRAGRPGRPVTLVGHSMAGVLLTQTAETVPDLIERVVYVSAWMVGTGKSFAHYQATPEMASTRIAPLILADPRDVGALRIDFDSADPTYRAGVKAAFAADVDDQTWAAATHLLTPDTPAAAFAEPVTATASRWGAIARTYVKCTEDNALPPAAQDVFIREADAFTPGNPTDVRELRSSHSPFLSRPEELARILLEP
jgi:pimeloyl-ACP methyl ester carboxylesterase